MTLSTPQPPHPTRRRRRRCRLLVLATDAVRFLKLAPFVQKAVEASVVVLGVGQHTSTTIHQLLSALEEAHAPTGQRAPNFSSGAPQAGTPAAPPALRAAAHAQAANFFVSNLNHTLTSLVAARAARRAQTPPALPPSRRPRRRASPASHATATASLQPAELAAPTSTAAQPQEVARQTEASAANLVLMGASVPVPGCGRFPSPLSPLEALAAYAEEVPHMAVARARKGAAGQSGERHQYAHHWQLNHNFNHAAHWSVRPLRPAPSQHKEQPFALPEPSPHRPPPP